METIGGQWSRQFYFIAKNVERPSAIDDSPHDHDSFLNDLAKRINVYTDTTSDLP